MCAQEGIDASDDLVVGQESGRFIDEFAEEFLAIEQIIVHGLAEFLGVDVEALGDSVRQCHCSVRKAGVVGEFMKHVVPTLRSGGNVEFTLASQDGGEKRGPDVAVVGVHGEFVEENVSSESACGGGVGGQPYDSHAAGKGDFQLFDAEFIEELMVVEIVGDFEGLTMLTSFVHEFAALAFAGGE